MNESFTEPKEEIEDLLEYSHGGLSTREAFARLHKDIDRALEEFLKTNKQRHGKVGLHSLLREGFHHNSCLSSFRWSSIFINFILVVFLIVACFTTKNQRYSALPLECIIILITMTLNIFIMVWETKLRHSELPNLTKRALSKLKDLSTSLKWSSTNYPHLHSPLSPCITLQWTKRDGCVVNLPWSLLVRGDVILLKPGQKVPGRCQLIEEISECQERIVLCMGDTYSPYLEGLGEGFSSPKARSQLHETKYLLLETPYISNLKIMLDGALNRPITVFNKQCHMLFGRMIEFCILPFMFFTSILLNVLRLFYDMWPGHWSDSLLVIPVSIVLPLLPIMLPSAWVFLNWYGTASILAIYECARRVQEIPSEDPLELEGTQLGNFNLSEAKPSWKEIKAMFGSILFGQQLFPVRTANLLHVLASVTNLCCVDKKGILSWPNPTAEKLFFLKNKGHQVASRLNICPSDPSLYGGDDSPLPPRGYAFKSPTSESECVLLSLSHDPASAFGLRFDDPSWKNYLVSLKPLGLNILMNTCNPATQNHYTRFCSQITCESMFNEDLVPVSQRRCLCELPKQMGFTSNARQPFHLEHQLCTFRHVPADMAYKDRLARSLMTTKLKFPFPHMVSVLLRDLNSGKLELMSQGTADIILDSCTDYWDGRDVCPLTEKDRKKILDFYHRMSLSAYCTAFAYRPTLCDIKEDLTNFYMELPIDPTHLYHAARMPTPHVSTEALFGDDDHTEYEEIRDVEDSFRMQCKQIFIGMVTMQYQAKTDMVQMIEQLDQACIRFVHFSKDNELRSQVFSEKMGLESGWNCHISLLPDKARAESGASSHANTASVKTSGLTLHQQSHEDLNSPFVLTRTKVSSYKDYCRSKSVRRKFLGLRSSLEVCRTLSHSAPSAINLEASVVKFDEGVSPLTRENSLAQLTHPDHQLMEECKWDDEMANDSGIHKDDEELLIADLDDEEEFESSRFNAHSPLIHSRHSFSSSDLSSSSSASSSLDLFDMSNRARLPKGIESVRPHLENVDNVPLLVSLFTDCTTPNTKAMLAIMQEYTEVTVLMGSSANAENMMLFMQADLCMGIDPLLPQVCMKEPVYLRPDPTKGPSPLEVARKLNSLPCSLSFHREDKISLARLILECRHFMSQMMNCFQFWACCCISTSCLLFLSLFTFLPPLLSSADVLWLVCVCLPVLSISLVFAPTNPAVMNQATGKNIVLCNKETIRYILSYYFPKFAPSMLVILVSAMLICWTFCHKMSQVERTAICIYVYPHDNTTTFWGGWDKHSYSLTALQKVVAFQLVLYFCVISISFVHKMCQIWKRNPLQNKVWAICVLCLVLMQLLYGVIALASETASWDGSDPGFSSLPFWIWTIILIWPVLLLPINELIKRMEIRVNVRYQKRARLEFGTKLGMNSPF